MLEREGKRKTREHCKRSFQGGFQGVLVFKACESHGWSTSSCYKKCCTHRQFTRVAPYCGLVPSWCISNPRRLMLKRRLIRENGDLSQLQNCWTNELTCTLLDLILMSESCNSRPLNLLSLTIDYLIYTNFFYMNLEASLSIYHI